MTFRGGVDERCHTVVDIGWSIGGDCRGGAHGADEHHRLVAVHGEGEEVSSLFHRVGSVCDEHAVVALVVEQLVDTLGEFEPHGVVHVLRPDVDELLAADLS